MIAGSSAHNDVKTSKLSRLDAFLFSLFRLPPAARAPTSKQPTQRRLERSCRKRSQSLNTAADSSAEFKLLPQRKWQVFSWCSSCEVFRSSKPGQPVPLRQKRLWCFTRNRMDVFIIDKLNVGLLKAFYDTLCDRDIVLPLYPHFTAASLQTHR